MDLTAPSAKNKKQRIWTKWTGTAAVLAAGIGLIVTFDDLNLEKVLKALSRFGPGALALPLLAAMAQVVSQIFRLSILLPSSAGLSWFALGRIFSFGQVLNTFLPARGGDLYKVIAINKAAPTDTVSVTRAAGSIFIADKAVDFASLCLLSPLVLRELPIESSRILIIGALIVLSVLLFRVFGPSLNPAIQFFTQPMRLLTSLAIGVASWSSEAIALILVSSALGHELSFGQSLSILFLLNVGITLPLTVANLGTFEAAMTFGLTRAGIPPAEALAIASVHHAIQITSFSGLALGFSITANKFRSFRVRSDDKARAIEYYDSLSREFGGYDATVSKGVLRYLRERERRAILRFARLEDDTKTSVIDVGCGGGFYSISAKRAGKQVHAIDLATGMIERIKNLVDHAEVADLESLATRETYDIVLCSGVMEFVMNPESAFHRLSNLVAPGGRLVILAPHDGYAGLLYRLEKRLAKISVNLYSRSWFSDRAKENGLVLKTSTHPLPTNIALLFEKPPLSPESD